MNKHIFYEATTWVFIEQGEGGCVEITGVSFVLQYFAEKRVPWLFWGLDFEIS